MSTNNNPTSHTRKVIKNSDDVIPVISMTNDTLRHNNHGSDENDDGVHRYIPREGSRQFLRDRIMTASAAAYIRLAVSISLDLEEAHDQSRGGGGGKTKKQKEQESVHQVYKDRLKTVLDSQYLFNVISRCLFLDSKKDKPLAATGTEHVLPLNEALGSMALLLCNFVLLTANGKHADSSESPSGHAWAGYDARIRNVLRMACIQILAESFEDADTDGSLRTRLQKHRRSKPKQDDGGEEGVQAQLGELFETQNLSHEQQDNNEGSIKLNLSSDDEINRAVYDNPYRRYASRKFQALEQRVADVIMFHIVSNSKQSSTMKDPTENDKDKQGKWMTRKNLVRAAKIGGVGVAAGALLAVTGGLAAPGIAAGLAALGVGGTALTLVASPPALIALFGVGGGGLSAYKMKRRTDGLEEFAIHQETYSHNHPSSAEGAPAHLHTTVCVSGWLKDKNDFQRPWGVTPPNLDRRERLQRFFCVVDPFRLGEVDEILKLYSEGSLNDRERDDVWRALAHSLKYQYGKSPDDELFPLMDCVVGFTEDESLIIQRIFDVTLEGAGLSQESTTTQQKSSRASAVTADVSPVEDSLRRYSVGNEVDANGCVWDQHSEYGGDIFTLHWESQILLTMCYAADNMVLELGKQATKEVIKRTAFATLMAAAALPSFLLGIAGSLDNNWTLITIRSDIAGIELAKSLLQSTEYRPVQLVGFSFGARVIVACLLELARHQAIWEEEQVTMGKFGKRLAIRKRDKDKDNIEYLREPASIVQDVVLMGAPVFISRSKLVQARQMVAGRFVNCFSRKDWILSLMFQYKNSSGFTQGTCGTGPVTGIGNVENWDVTTLVDSRHSNYCRRIPDILDHIGFDQPYPM